MRPSVTFRAFSPHVASSRYRALIPQVELLKVGVEPGRDILVIGKHSWDWDVETAGYKRVVFDVCDDHFDSEHARHYYMACSQANMVTCNSRSMQTIIRDRTGRIAWVIPDPYESPQGPARVHGDEILWFGHKGNLIDLQRIAPYLPSGKVVAVSNFSAELPGVRMVQWSPEEMERRWRSAGLVVLPTGKSEAKSANRAIESIRQGVFPVCGVLPAYADLGVWVGDVAHGVEWALTHHDEVMGRIREAQHYVSYEYSPARIAKLWLEALAHL